GNDNGRRRSARGRRRPEDRARVRAHGYGGRPGLCLATGSPQPDERVGPGGPARRRAAHLGRRNRPPAGVRVAYYSPQPPERSGIADYSALLLPALAERIDVDVVRRRSRRRRRADVSLYHIGNDPDAHGWIVEALRRRPGIVVLHDFVLHHLVAGMTLGRGNGGGYLDAMQREAGAVGRMLAHGVIDELLPPLWEDRAADYPLAGEVLMSANGLIIHSAYVERLVRDSGYGGPVWRIPHPALSAPAEIAP